MDSIRQNGGAGGRDMNRAERFEEEKRRIVESCFNKKDVDGSLLETYITHIRITEYATHPSSPPPPETRSQSEKPRVIIVAVRKSGRVRMHKSKENANGSFSIGKTWDLNDLTGIESFTGPTADPQKREWAGDTGFVVNIGKPYYWQAQADKEKKFFVASLIKIYGKYTGGGTPDLKGFDPRELDQVLGSRRQPPGQPPGPPPGRTPPPPSVSPRNEPTPPRPAPTPPRPAPTPPRVDNRLSPAPPRNDAIPPPRAPSRPSSRPPSRPERAENKPALANIAADFITATSGMPQFQRPRSPARSPARNLEPPNGTPSPATGPEPGRNASQPPALRRLAANNKSQDSVATSGSTARSDDAGSLPPRSRGGMPGPGAFGRLGDSQDAVPQVDLPDRKRPPMDPTRPQGARDNDLVPAPLMSPGARREPPPRSAERTPTLDSINDKPSEVITSREKAKPEPVGNANLDRKDSSNETPAASFSPSPAAETPPPENAAEDDESRPGLGPMIKAKRSQKDIAGSLWKAASAAAVFKPRPGGAGERLREAAKKSTTEGPDGITGVVPAPPRPTPAPEMPKPAEDEGKTEKMTPAVPEVRVTVPHSSRPNSLQPEKSRPSLEEQRKSEDSSRRLNVTGNDAKYLSALGIDTSYLSDKPAEFTTWLDHFGWVPGRKMRANNFEEMKLDIDRELNKAQAGGWVTKFQEEDERIEAIKRGLDLSIGECDELDNLLTLYSVELSTLSDDIAYIEAQGQGLQVQTANQKLLRKELESLLETCAITADDLQALKTSPLDTTLGLADIERALMILYKAMMKIDSSMTGGEPRKSEDTSALDQQAGLNPDYGKMRIVQEKKEMYRYESVSFLQRFGGFMSRQIDKATQETKTAIRGALAKKVDPRNHDTGRNMLWQYSPLVLYARDVDLEQWDRFLQIYQEKSLPLYKSEIKGILDAWKQNARKPTGGELQLLFTSQVEKQQEGRIETARKLTVKRSQTLARSLRSPIGEGGRGGADKAADSRSLPYEVFAGIMDDLLPLVEIEQNFIVDFFHATTLETADFPDLVSLTGPRERRSDDLKKHRVMEPDRELARRVTRAMEAIFSFFEQDMQSAVGWVLSQDPLQGIGVLAILERKHLDMTQSNQDFLNNVLQKVHNTLETRLSKFVDEQIRAIEETKVKIKKRKGVIGFMRVFPHFSTAIENMLVGVETHSSTRRTVDQEYDRIIKTMFDSLKVIARENPATLTSSGADPEDKEALNYHILLIENMNHLLEELDTHGLEILEDWKQAAADEMAEHMGLYLNAVMRRPLGKLLEHLENIETQLVSGKSMAIITAQPSNSKATFNKVLGSYDGREVRKGVDALRKRVEKHFGDAEDDNPSAGRGLVNRVLQQCEKFYGDVEMRISTVTANVYGGDVLFEWPRADVKSAFSNTGR
ncbi:exocyst complex component Sec3-domain-containing protein [Xylariaceae sp. FL0804]|nr:exocyst complex component Sec3-domain-containing protein [Xylariaceae sp. FL0804]